MPRLVLPLSVRSLASSRALPSNCPAPAVPRPKANVPAPSLLRDWRPRPEATAMQRWLDLNA
jgi:hypothetical protein